MMKYRLTFEAENDLIRIYQYGVRQFGRTQAEKYYNSLFNCFDSIAERPYSFESVDFIKIGYRRCVCNADSIYFKINGEEVEIITIIGRQDFTDNS